ncbi:DUF1499 domain-containing protein [Meridianimarinicoccus aquatilis]|nr:DUF1499 domain-containing protein [Fluviibacterium aquatile]QIE41520.1 DUF1499 domain-containing protein [Rhodobacteraceae bacterium SC52]
MRVILFGLEALVGICVLAALGFAVWVRIAPTDPAQWHVDPLTVSAPSFSGYYLMRPEGGQSTGPVFDMSPAELLAAFDRIALNTPHVERIAGSVDDGFVTYVARSDLWRFPDYISVRTVPAEDSGARLAVYSRLRFGSSDMGANRARLEDWIGQIRSAGA